MQVMDGVTLMTTAPTPASLIALRQRVGWTSPAVNVVEQSLANSLFIVCAYDGARLVGTGRIVGDGAMYFYLQDLLVDPEYQRQGIGRLLMEEIESFLRQRAQPGATIGLFAAHGKEDFYQAFGYQRRTGQVLGMGMCKFV
ncbi:GNAT family N-acetyltransferase [Shewanella amazonensis]|uniref:Acetyltransferase, GNAT family n=1 Tax=Shewanella amazonensis (strain ATCC BAA-1098 / SB2B) TaxID=326297 RepID=A1S637_SHEAM|nr:acetyltransferase, GNAT family [Shewanella amazonensis SB2B]